MITTHFVTLYQHEQPDALWSTVDDLLAGLAVDRSLDFARAVSLGTASAADELAVRLRDVGLVVHVSSDTVLDDSDYEQADYVGVYGAEPGEGLVKNPDRALVPTGPCPACGGQDILDVEQAEPFEIDRTQLDLQVEVVQLPGGGLAVSDRLARLLDGLHGIRRTELTPGLVQLSADRLVLVPCRTHTTVHGDPHCTDCGRARGEVVGYFWVSGAQVAGADLVARNRNGMSFLFASRRLLEVLGSPTGLSTYDVMRVCNHGSA